jgi:hypothetical protein
LIRHSIRFFLSHAFFAALCAVALCMQTLVQNGLPTANGLLPFVFFSTLAAYNFHFAAGLAYRAGWNMKIKDWTRSAYAWLFGMMLPLSIWLAIDLHLPAIPLALAILLTGGYSLPLFPFMPAQKFAGIGVLKTLLLAFTWSWVTVVLPLSGNKELLFSVPSAWIFLHRLLFLFILCLLFDARDRSADSLAGLHTLATALSPRQTRRLVSWLLALLALLNLLSGFVIGWRWALAQLFVWLPTALVCRMAAQPRGFHFYYIVVDGLMILSGLVNILAGYLVNLP